jgi:hypothetical protein
MDMMESIELGAKNIWNVYAPDFIGAAQLFRGALIFCTLTDEERSTLRFLSDLAHTRRMMYLSEEDIIP